MAADGGNGRDTLPVVSIVISLVALIGTMVGVGLGARAIDEARKPARVSAGAGGATAAVSLKEFSIEPKTIRVKAGGTLQVANRGSIEHDLAVDGHDELKTPLIRPRGSATLDLGDLPPGTYGVHCTVPGHADAGMRATLTVGEGGTAQTAAAGPTPEEIDRLTKKSIDDFLAGAKTEGKGAQLMQPTVLPDGTKEYRLTASEFDWEVSPGKKVKVWGYNGVVPGPLIRLNSGDKFRLVLRNELPESTSIHFHGIETPNNMDGVPGLTQKPVKKGETFTYEFVAKGPAVGLYHAHQDSQKQVPMGLLGPIVIDDLPVPAGVVVRQRIPMVLNDAGNIGYSLNGKSFPATDPIVMARDEWIRIDYMNEGLQIHPMHTHGFGQLIIARDGHPIPQPYWEDTVLVAPGQRISVLVHGTESGAWLLHCHILTHAESERGYFGMATAMVVK